MVQQPDHDLIAGIYATAGAQDAWRPVLDRLCRDLGVQSAVVQLLQVRKNRLTDVWTQRDLKTHAHATIHDQWARSDNNPRLTDRPATGTPRRIGSDRRLFDGDQRARGQLNDGLSRIGLGHAFWAGCALPGDLRFSLVLHREAGDPRDIDPAEEAFLQALLPHLEQAAQLGVRIDQADVRTQQMEVAIECSGSAVLVCDTDQRVQWLNPAAEEIIGCSRHVSIRNGHLRCHSSSDSTRLRLRLEAIAGGVSGAGVAAIGPAGDSPLHLRITPIDPDAAGRSSALAIVLTAPETRQTLDAEDLIRLFGLTRAESNLAAAIAGGHSISQFAAARGITIGTARFQLRQVLAKTGTRRQAELVQQLSASSARFRTSMA